METPKPAAPEAERFGAHRTAPAPKAAEKSAEKSVTAREFVAPVGGVVEGRAYWLDGHLVIADTTAGVGATCHALTGTVECDKIHEEAWTAGDPVYWYAAGACLTNGTGVPVLPGTLRAEPPPEPFKVGVADKDAPRPSVTGFVRLDAIPNAP